MYDLTAFQRDCLRGIAVLGDPHGLAIKTWLEQEAEYQDVNHGRLYPNLDTLVERGFIEKDSRDLRTNEYHLTRRGGREVSRHYTAWGKAAEAVEDNPVTDGGTSFPDAAEEALRLDPGDEDGLGVRADELMDARMDAGQAEYALRDIYVTLDSIADDRGLFPAEVNDELRHVQTRVQRLKGWTAGYHAGLRELERAARRAEQEASR